MAERDGARRRHGVAGAVMLQARGLDVLLGDYQVLWSAHLDVQEGEIVALLGPNGAGKSTLMNTISGLLRPQVGEVAFAGRSIAGLPAHRIVREGISHVLERRRLFPYLTVRQNVLLGAYNPAARAGPRGAVSTGQGAVPAHRLAE